MVPLTSLSMAINLSKHKIVTALHKYYSYEELSVNFCDTGRSCEVQVNNCKTLDEEGFPKTLFKGTASKAIN